MKLRDLARQVSEECRELIERYSLRIMAEREDPYGVQVTLENSAAALRIRWEWRERRLFLSIFRLDRGPVAPVWDLESRIRDPLNGFDVDDLIAATHPELTVEQEGLSTRRVLA